MRLAAVTASTALLALALEAHAQAVPAFQLPDLSSVALAPELDRVLRDYEAAWRRGHGDGLAGLFAADGFVLQGGRAPVRGRAAIREAYAGHGGGPLRLRALAAATADTVGYIIGAYGYGDAPGDQGKFTTPTYPPFWLRSRSASPLADHDPLRIPRPHGQTFADVSLRRTAPVAQS